MGYGSWDVLNDISDMLGDWCLDEDWVVLDNGTGRQGRFQDSLSMSSDNGMSSVFHGLDEWGMIVQATGGSHANGNHGAQHHQFEHFEFGFLFCLKRSVLKIAN